MAQMKDLIAEEKPKFGAKVNVLKQTLEQAYAQAQERIQQQAIIATLEKDKIDLTLPATKLKVGTLHPLTLVQKEIEEHFIGMGYLVKEGLKLNATTIISNGPTFRRIIRPETCRILSTSTWTGCSEPIPRPFKPGL